MKEKNRLELTGALTGGFTGLATGFAASLRSEGIFAKAAWGILPTIFGGVAGFYLGRVIAPEEKVVDDFEIEEGKGLGVM